MGKKSFVKEVTCNRESNNGFVLPVQKVLKKFPI